MRNLARLCLLVVCATFAAAAPARADVISPFSCIGAETTCPSARSTFNGDVVAHLASTSQLVAMLTGAYDGTLMSGVHQNTERSNQLDFHYQLTNSASSEGPTRMTMFDVAGFRADVSDRADVNQAGLTPGEGPQFVDRDGGSTLGFAFADASSSNPNTGVNPGEQSSVVPIQTPGLGSGTDPSGEVKPGSGSSPADQPGTPVPEPSSVMLLGAGLAGLVARARRKRPRL